MYPEYPYLGYKDENLKTPLTFRKQHQDQKPGFEYLMDPPPIFDNPDYIPSHKLNDKVAVISGGDSGIGRAVAILFAKEGADVVLVYLNETDDAMKTKQLIEGYERKCITIQCDLRKESSSRFVIDTILKTVGKVDILVNNCATQFPQNSLLDITASQLKMTFETNVYSFFYLTKAILPHLKEHASIINTASITAFAGEQTLLDYSSTKGAVVSFTRSLALSLVDQKIRVNAVAPGPVWTPIIPSTFPEDRVETFGADVPLKRAGQPFEIAPTYLYLASDDSRFVTGQVLHVNGGTVV
ncbi:MAG: SDR family oxidoreductase [Clostridia bacterium]